MLSEDKILNFKTDFTFYEIDVRRFERFKKSASDFHFYKTRWGFNDKNYNPTHIYLYCKDKNHKYLIDNLQETISHPENLFIDSFNKYREGIITYNFWGYVPQNDDEDMDFTLILGEENMIRYYERTRWYGGVK